MVRVMFPISPVESCGYTPSPAVCGLDGGGAQSYNAAVLRAAARAAVTGRGSPPSIRADPLAGAQPPPHNKRKDPMALLRIDLDDWQQATLAAMARARGVGLETMAQRLLRERLVESIRRACEELVPDLNLACPPPVPDTIEQRLRLIFDV